MPQERKSYSSHQLKISHRKENMGSLISIIQPLASCNPAQVSPQKHHLYSCKSIPLLLQNLGHILKKHLGDVSEESLLSCPSCAFVGVSDHKQSPCSACLCHEVNISAFTWIISLLTQDNIAERECHCILCSVSFPAETWNVIAKTFTAVWKEGYGKGKP